MKAPMLSGFGRLPTLEAQLARPCLARPCLASCASSVGSLSNPLSTGAFVQVLSSLRKARQHFSKPCNIFSPCMLAPPIMLTIVGSCFAHLSAPLVQPSCSSPTKPTSHGSLRLPCSLLTTNISCGKLGRPVTLQKPQTSQPTGQHASLRLLTISNIAPQIWPRCSTACAKVTFSQHTSAATSSANQSLRPSLLCGIKAQTDCYNQLRSALLSGPVIAQTCCQQEPPAPPSVLAQLPNPIPSPLSIPPYPEPSLEEFVKANKRLKNNKSPGICNILPEMLKYGGDEVHLAMHRLILGIWHTESGPQDFQQDILIPIPTKG